MRSINVDVDIDIDDIVYNMSKYDRKELFKAMKEDGYISDSCVITEEGEIESSVEVDSTDDFDRALVKLFKNGWKLTKEEEEYVINLSKRFC